MTLTMHCEIFVCSRRRDLKVKLTDRVHFRTYRKVLHGLKIAGRIDPYRIKKSIVVGKWAGNLRETHWRAGKNRCFAASLDDHTRIYFMWNGDIRRGPGNRIHPKEEDSWNDYCMTCGKHFTKTPASPLCCENASCRHICCHDCLGVHGRAVQAGKVEDFFCDDCREKCDGACEESCAGCSCELNSLQEVGATLKVWVDGAWQPTTVIEYLPAGQPDENGQTSIHPYHHLQIGKSMRKWMHLTTGVQGNQFSKFVMDGVGGWKL